MGSKNLGIIILAAGAGTRMKSARPKVLQPLAGKPMLGYVIEAAQALDPQKMTVVTGHGSTRVEAFLKANYPGVSSVLQKPQQGTGHALMVARDDFRQFNGDLLILFGDCPLVRPKTLKDLLAARKPETLSLIGIECRDPGKYGRLVLAGDGSLEKIVEFADATEKEKSITFCNSGVMIGPAKVLFKYLDDLENNNAKGEYYLTDVIGPARKDNHEIPVIRGKEEEFQGVNTKAELARAEAAGQERLRQKALEKGVTLIAPETVYFSHDTELAADVTVHPFVVFGEGVQIGEGATIYSFCHLEGCQVGKGASIGPHARLRPGAKIGEDAKIGNFVEVKKSRIGKGAKASHLAYLGDAEVGPKANIGAGVITCNYDGFSKFKTEVGKGAFIGSNASLVAPVKIGAGAIVGAGSVITKDVGADDLSVARAKQENLKGGAKTFRSKKDKN